MKKLVWLLATCFIAATLNAQSLDDVVELINKQKWKESKVAIDKFLSDPKNQDKSDAWYFKGRIYNGLSYDKTIAKSEVSSLRWDAFEAFKKTQQLDTKDIRMKVDGYRPYLDLYYGFYDLGAGLFNDKDYMNSYQSFSRAIDIKDFILVKNYDFTDAKLYKLDTALVLNMGIAASLAKQDSLAMIQYKRLIDASVSEKKYMELYEAAVEYYFKKGDIQNMNAVLAKAKMYFPENDYWANVEMDVVRKTGDKVLLMNKYKEMIEKNPSNFAMSYNYSVELFNSLYGKDAITKDIAITREALTNTLKKTIPNDKGIESTVLLANHFYNTASDISAELTRIKGTSPEAVKKKADLNAQYNKSMDEFILYAEQASKWYDAQPSLKPVQKGIYKGMLSNLSEVYTVKKDAKKASATDAKKNAL